MDCNLGIIYCMMVLVAFECLRHQQCKMAIWLNKSLKKKNCSTVEAIYVLDSDHSKVDCFKWIYQDILW